MKSPKPYKRTERIEHQILEILGEIATKHIDLSKLGFITFTNAKISPDLQHAKVFFSVINKRIVIEDIVVQMNNLRGPFRKYLAPELHIKFIPDLKFFYDETMEYTQKIETMIDSIKVPEADDN